MMKEILLVGAGGFVGSVLRYLVSLAMRSSAAFPWGTFAVNIVGCLLIGALWGYTSRHPQFPAAAGLFLTVGLCGGFTTFSTFSRESLALLQGGQWTAFALYVAGSVIVGIAAVALGYRITS